jgi:hypothetical protein
MTGNQAIETIKSFKTLLSTDDYAEFMKSEDSSKLRAFPEVVEFLKGEKPWEKDKEGEEDDKEDDKEDKEEHEAGESKEKEKKEEDTEKAVSSEMLKGLSDEMNSKFKTVTEMIQKSLDTEDRIADLQKSIDSVTTLVEKIADMPLGNKAIKNAMGANFFEKALGGEQEDESGKKMLSVSAHKEQILKSLEDGMNKAVEPELKKSYEDSIVRYNGGGGTINQTVAMDLFENFGIRLVK